MGESDMVAPVSRRRLLKIGVWFSLFNALFVLLISMKYNVLVPNQIWSEHPFYLCAYILTHFVFITFLPLFFCYLPITILARSTRANMIASASVSTICLILLAIDAYVFSLYRFHLNYYVLEQVFAPGATQVFEFTVVQYLLVAALLAVLFAVEVGLFKLASLIVDKIPDWAIYAFGFGFTFLIVVVQFRHVVAYAKNERQLVLLDRYFPANLSFNANPVLSALGVRVENPKVHVNYLGKSYQYPKGELRNFPTGKNVVVIAFDSWRAATMDSLCSPHIYEFSKRASRFEKHYSGSNGTRTGVFSMFYGLPGVYWRDFCKQSISPVLVKTLKEEGYVMRLFPSASMQNPPLDKCVFCLASDQCLSAPGNNAWQRDENVAEGFLTFLRSRGEGSAPFFSFLFFDSLHSMIKPEGYEGPFQPSWDCAHYERLGKDTDPFEFLNLYKNMVYYLDGLVKQVLDELERQGLLENTIVVITGDHSQEFNDCQRGYWGHNGNYSAAQMQVPMIYYNGKDSIVTNRWTSHYDLVPTLMRDVFGTLNDPSDYAIGTHLMDSTATRDFLLVDSYIGIGMIDASGNITNVYYDGDYSITDQNARDRFKAKFDDGLLKRAEAQISQFWK